MTRMSTYQQDFDLSFQVPIYHPLHLSRWDRYWSTAWAYQVCLSFFFVVVVCGNETENFSKIETYCVPLEFALALLYLKAGYCMHARSTTRRYSIYLPTAVISKWYYCEWYYHKVWNTVKIICSTHSHALRKWTFALYTDESLLLIGILYTQELQSW